MPSTKSLNEAVAKLHVIQKSLVAISERTDPAWKLDLVNMRRQLALQIGIVSKTAETEFLLDVDQHIVSEFRKLLSAMRRGIALHQAEFPAVKLDKTSLEYSQSVKVVRDANIAFLQWAELNLRDEGRNTG